MRGEDAVPVDDDDAGGDGFVERGFPCEGDQLRRAQVCLQRECQQHAAHGLGESPDAEPQEVLDLVRKREIVAARRYPVRGQRASDLECEERISERRIEDSADQGSRQRETKPVGEHSPRRAEAQVPDVEAPQRPPVNRALESRQRPGPTCQQERHRLGVETTRREGERVR